MFDAAPDNKAMPAFITAELVATLIGLPTANAFLGKRDELELRHAFPLPMPGSKRPMRWRTSQVLAWVDRQGRPAEVEIPAGTNVERLRQKARTA